MARFVLKKVVLPTFAFCLGLLCVLVPFAVLALFLAAPKGD